MESSNQLSYSCCPSTTPYIYETIPDRLRHLAATDPDRNAFVFYNLKKERTSLTREQVLDQSIIVAENFVKSGIEKGSAVAICMTNSLEMLVSNMGVLMAGGVPFFVSANLKDGSDLAEVINNFEAKFLIIDTNTGDENWKILENIWPESLSCAKVTPCLKMVICNGKIDRETETRKSLNLFQKKIEDKSIKLPTILPEDTLTYFCTSGSTGKPKDVAYTHFGIMNWTRSADQQLNITDKSVFFCDRTFSWGFGYPRTYATEGATRIFADTKLSITEQYSDFVADVIRAECCDVVYLPGYMVVDMLNKPDITEKFNKVKTLILGGEIVRSAYYQAVKKRLCNQVLSLYGTTESGLVCTYNGDDFEDGLIGKPLEGVEIKVVDETGTVLPVGSQGELCIRCPFRFEAYWDMKKLFYEVVDLQNWIHTGDISRMREDGNFIIEGRGKEMISIGTIKFFPWSIEKILRKIPGVKHVFVVGVPDIRLGQVVCACVLPEPGTSLSEADVAQFCDEIFLQESTSFGINVKPVYHFIMDKVPVTASGKLDRQRIGLIAKEKLGL